MFNAKSAFVIMASAASLILAGGTGAVADAETRGSAEGSPGVLSGNVIQVPVRLPANICGNTLNVIGLLNPTFGNWCADDSNGPDHHHHDSSQESHDKHHGPCPPRNEWDNVCPEPEPEEPRPSADCCACPTPHTDGSACPPA